MSAMAPSAGRAISSTRADVGVVQELDALPGTDAGDAVTPEILTTGICNEFICAPPSACRAISSTWADVGVVQELAALSGRDAAALEGPLIGRAASKSR